MLKFKYLNEGLVLGAHGRGRKGAGRTSSFLKQEELR